MSRTPSADSNSSLGISGSDLVTWEPTAYQRDLLKKSWNDDFNFLYALGTDIYVYIFTNTPEAKQLFPSVAQHGDKWKESHEFKAQALRFVQVLSNATKNVYRLECLDRLLYRIGASHARYASRGFRSDHWLMFQSAIEVSMGQHISQLDALTQQEKKDAVDLWKFLAEYIINKMYKGFQAEMLGRLSRAKTRGGSERSNDDSSPPPPGPPPPVEKGSFEEAEEGDNGEGKEN